MRFALSNHPEIIRAAYEAGSTPNEIAARMGCTGARIRQILNAIGVRPARYRVAPRPAPLDGEEWRPIAGWPYEVSNRGNIRRTILYLNSRGRVSLSTCSGGYPGFTLCAQGKKKKTVLVHELVAIAFLGPRPSPDHIVAHFDGSRNNNRLENLRWATRTENEDDKRRHGRNLAGERNHQAKLTDEGVLAIRSSSEPLGALANRYGVSKNTTWKARRGMSWKHL